MTCPTCKIEKKTNFDIFSIQKRGRCVDCHIEFVKHPENDPDLKTFEVEASATITFKVYAKDEESAREEAEEKLDNFDGRWYIEDITERARK